MQPNDADKLYICPGETHPISRSVHLSRLAAFYPTCRDCPLRHETGQLPQHIVERLQTTERRAERKSIFTAEGVRGSYRNELTRRRAADIAAAVASLLWDAAPVAGHREESELGSRRNRPTVVIAHDDRPSSPDIVTGVATGLRRMGCHVVDLSLSTRPCFVYCVDHLHASAGIYVTGAGCDPSWTGLEIVGRGGEPISAREVSPDHSVEGLTPSPIAAATASAPFTLEDVEARLQQPASRPTRSAGVSRAFQGHVPYEAGLWKHFHALRPLRIVAGCRSLIIRRTLETIFAQLPCQLEFVPIADRIRNLSDSRDPDMQRLKAAVLNRSADLGLLIDDDGERCGFVDETGAAIASRHILQLLADHLLRERTGAIIALEPSVHEELAPALQRRGATAVRAGSTRAALARTVRDQRAGCGGGDSHRFWFLEGFPACDGIITLARVLSALSCSDATFSESTRRYRNLLKPLMTDAIPDLPDDFGELGPGLAAESPRGGKERPAADAPLRC